jgi:hypothetical protein
MRGCMRSSSALALSAALVWSSVAAGQAAPPVGFAAERLSLSAPGAGWMVMDALDMQGALGGAAALSGGYAHDPWVVTGSDGRSTAVVSDQAFADVGVAVTYDRFRFSANLESPLLVRGAGGPDGGLDVTLGNSPDTISDVRFGFEARLIGDARDAFRLGLSVQLYIPSGVRADYVTDGTVRAMGRLLMAGDVGAWSYAGQVGLHYRPDGNVPGADATNSIELLFGAAVGRRFPVGWMGSSDLVVGPEVFGETSLTQVGPTSNTGVEALLSARLEETGEAAERLRLKLGVGVGLDPNFGAPQWRAVLSVEGFGLASHGPP